MTEFGMKCREIITQSNSNIYQLSKQSGLDRTTLQKMVKGERLPSLQFVIDMCSFLKVNQREQKELLSLYQIEKIGRSVYETRQEIQKLIVNMQKVRKVWLSSVENAVKIVSLAEEVPEVRYFELKLDVADALRMAVIRELEEQEKPELFFDMYYSVEVVMQQLIREERNINKEITCHQNIKFFRKPDGSSSIDNISTLKYVLPFAYTFHNTYDVRYTYVDGNKKDDVFEPWPHYLITSNQCLLISADEERAMLITNPHITADFIVEIKRIVSMYNPLLTFKGVAEQAVGMYMQVIRQGKIPSFVIESHPCISRMFTKKMIETWNGNDYLEQMAGYVYGDNYQQDKRCKCFFGFNDMKSFIDTGRLPGMYGEYYRICNVRERKEMLNTFCGLLSTCKWESYLIKEDIMPIDAGFYLELYGTQRLILCTTHEVERLVIICIEESSICEAFMDYFIGLENSDYVYNSEDTETVLRKKISEGFSKL